MSGPMMLVESTMYNVEIWQSGGQLYVLSACHSSHLKKTPAAVVGEHVYFICATCGHKVNADITNSLFPTYIDIIAPTVPLESWIGSWLSEVVRVKVEWELE